MTNNRPWIYRKEDTDITKTPEEMAEEYIEAFRGDKSALGGKIGLSACRLSFLAGYKAAMDRLADASKVINSSNNSNGWISVKEEQS